MSLLLYTIKTTANDIDFMHTKPILFTFIILVLVSSSNCNRHKALPVDKRCNNSIEQADKMLKDKPNSHNKADTERIKNLIKAAKIQQQHGRFNSCVDKTNRALTLMKEDLSRNKTP